ncbi:MAG: phosphatase PAP2-related protein [Rubripirellula sp.]
MKQNAMLYGSRLVFVVVGLGLWFWTQSLIGARELESGAIGDGVHELLAGANQYLHQHPGAADLLLIVSSAVIDVLGVFLLLRSIFGATLRPFIGLLLVFAMRQACQWLCALEPPNGMIWRDPGFPSLLVTYGVATDFFFSGHTALAVLGAVELGRIGGKGWVALGILIVAFEVTTVLVLRAHYTMDVFAGAVAARYATILAARFAPRCDRWLANVTGRSDRAET